LIIETLLKQKTTILVVLHFLCFCNYDFLSNFLTVL
jgi:hypothetical protein